MKTKTLRIAIVLFLFIFTTLLDSKSAHGGSNDQATVDNENLAPRFIPEKPSHTKLGTSVFQDHIYVQFAEGSGIRLRNGKLVSNSGRNIASLRRILAGFPGIQIERLYSRPERQLDKERSKGQNQSKKKLADKNLAYIIWTTGKVETEDLIDALNNSPFVELAEPAPIVTNPQVNILGDYNPQKGYLSSFNQKNFDMLHALLQQASVSGDYTSQQGYLEPSSENGIDARYAWTQPGGRGQGVLIIDLEHGWNIFHEDLTKARNAALNDFPQEIANTNHGTAVLGELVGDDNTIGVTGIVPDAEVGLVSWSTIEAPQAIDRAAQTLGPGDIMLLEGQIAGPNEAGELGDCNCGSDDDCVPMEWNLQNRIAIEHAVSNGIVVVEAAGNGGNNLDDSRYGITFDRNYGDSGAIIVGAGHSDDYICILGICVHYARERMDFSNYGSRVDVQGWGENVVTTGYGGLYPGGDPVSSCQTNTTNPPDETLVNQFYYDKFSGTSAASPIVAGAVAAIQGVSRNRYGNSLSPNEVRRILVDTGTAQTGNTAEHIGPLPNLRAALDSITPPPTSAIINNGVIQLGINAQGHLNVYGGTTSSGGTTATGLRYMPTNAEATAPGCLCEGWGAADVLSGVSGYANVDIDGVVNLTHVGFTSTASTARSTVQIGNTLRVTHDFHPAQLTTSLYEVTVTIENISNTTVRPRYRRVMDWDIEPTAFDEYVTINRGTSSALLFSSDNGFETANPLGPRSTLDPATVDTTFTDNGPSDHGALFDFGFADLASHQSVTFRIYYGAAGDERTALSALTSVGAEVYSLGQPNTENGPTLGQPNTFIFAFTGVGGAPVPSGSTISGTVYANDVAPENTLAGAVIEACKTDLSFCVTTVTNAAGQYAASGLLPGIYNIRANSPSGTIYITGTIGPIEISYNEIRSGQDIVLHLPPPPPPNPIEPAHTGGGTIVVYWRDSLTFTAHGCPDGTATFELTVLEDGYQVNGAMAETPSGSGTYKATIPPLYPHHGVARVIYTIVCPDGSTDTITFDIYIDPSGVVKTVTGTPVPGATVTLFRSDNPDGPFNAVPDGSAIMSPSNRTNPDTTNASGQFGWDVVSGFYKVRAEKDECISPADPSQSYVESTVLTIPPPVTDLELILDCPSANEPPILTVPNEQSIQYSDPVSFTVSATDPDNLSNTLAFTSAGLPNALSLSDNGDGTATISGVANVAPGTYTADITVADPDGLSDTKTIDIVVTKEDAHTTYTGPLMVSTGCESCSTAIVPLRATIQDITAVMRDAAYDPDPGNITHATVSFVDRNNGDAVLCNSSVVLMDPSDSKAGTAFCDWTADLGNSSGNDYVVGIVVDGYYTRNSSDEDTVVVVSKPTSNFITGGGYLINQNSGGTYFGDTDLKTNFGLNIKFNKKLTNLQGRVTIIVRQGGRVYQIKSNALSSLVSVPYNPAKPRTGTAELIGKANITDVTDPLNPVAVIGNATLNIVMKDNGEPGSSDLISISLWSRDGELLFSSHWDGVQTLQQLLDGGNLNIK